MNADHNVRFPASMLWLLAAMSLIWGVNWTVMKVAIAEFPPLHFRAFCLVWGGAGLFAIAAFARLPMRMPRGQWPNLIVQAAFNMGVWNVLAVLGLATMDSGRAAIIAYTFPVWSTLLSVWWLREPMTARKIAGLVLGMAAIALLLANDLAAVGRSPLGATLMAGSAISWAIGTVMMRRHPVGLAPLPLTAWQTLIAAVPLTAAAMILEPGVPWYPPDMSLAAQLGVLYNVGGSFIFCIWAWFKIASIAPPSVSSLATLAIPVVGVISGALFLGERPGWTDLVALALVAAALATVLIVPRKAT